MGMGLDLYRSSRAAKRVFEEIDDALSFALTKTIFEGPDEELEKTINSQPAIMAASLACVKAMDELFPMSLLQPVAVAGHSLGEYTSLVTSGSLQLGDGIRLVRERGRLMQEASELVPGSMAAIMGLDETTMEEICQETGAEVANINWGDQIVISGDRLCVARAIDMASIRGAKRAIPLAVSGAFHSSLMSPASEGLEAAIDEAGLRDPGIPVIANSTSIPMTTSQDVREELLAQLCTCVQWKRSVCCMIELGVTSFIEFGPGRVLSGLIKRISSSPLYRDRGVEVLSVNNLDSARALAEALGPLGWSRRSLATS